jgi:L-fuconate dehydratase
MWCWRRIGSIEGHGLTFTLGKGTELCVAAVNALAPALVGKRLEDITTHMGAWWQRFANPDQLRWVGPEKGVLHLAVAALVNAVWDLWGKAEDKPVWRLVGRSHAGAVRRSDRLPLLTDCTDQGRALAILKAQAPGKAARIASWSAWASGLTRLRRDGWAIRKTRCGA